MIPPEIADVIRNSDPDDPIRAGYYIHDGEVTPIMDAIEGTDVEDGLPADAQARAVEVGNAIQHAVAGRPDIAVSTVGIGLDLLSTTLIQKPDTVLDLAPWVRLAADVFAYVTEGTTTPKLDLLLSGDLEPLVHGLGRIMFHVQQADTPERGD